MGAWLEHERLGYNYRLDEMSSALGASQMLRIETFLTRRERVAQAYNERLAAFDWLDTPQPRPYVRMSWFVYVITLKPGLSRDTVMTALQAQGVSGARLFLAYSSPTLYRAAAVQRHATFP